MKLTRIQKGMLGFPIVCGIGLTGLIVPIVLADQQKNVAWLLLWVVAALILGVALMALDKWIQST